MGNDSKWPGLGSWAVAAFLSWAVAGCTEEASAPPPLEIPYVTVEAREVAIPLDVVGQTMGSTDVTIRARIDGFLEAMHFQEGDFVEENQLLYTIDPQPLEAKLAQAQAALAQANTSLVKTQSDLERIRPLAEMNAVSAQDLDAAVANHEAARSYVEAAEAQVELAQIELGYTKIRSPVRGLIGLTQAEVGDYVSQQSNGGLLNVVSRTDPTAVRVAITEELYLRAARRLADRLEADELAAASETRNRARADLTLLLADGNAYEHRGYYTKVDRNIDPTTGSLTIEAEFPNPDNILRPGMFARIRFEAERLNDAILVPQRAVNELQSAYRMFVINDEDTIEVRQVTVGPRLGSEWIITSGIEAGDRVAVEGLLRLREGMPVLPREATADDLPAAAQASL
jgi:membrane fusion protein (multidrug efflux system)